MTKNEVSIEGLRISAALIISFFCLFLLKELDLVPISNEYFFLLEWFGFIAVISLFLSYLIAFIVLDRKKIMKVNYKDSKVYIYGVVFTASIYLILLVYFG